MWNKYFRWTAIKPTEEKEIDRPEEKGRVKRLEVSVSSKSMNERVIMRIWEDPEHEVKQYDTEALTCWFGAMTKLMVWHRADGWNRVEVKGGLLKRFKKWDTRILDKLSTWTNSKILGRIRAERFTTFSKASIESSLGPICFSSFCNFPSPQMDLITPNGRLCHFLKSILTWCRNDCNKIVRTTNKTLWGAKYQITHLASLCINPPKWASVLILRSRFLRYM